MFLILKHNGFGDDFVCYLNYFVDKEYRLPSINCFVFLKIFSVT